MEPNYITCSTSSFVHDIPILFAKFETRSFRKKNSIHSISMALANSLQFFIVGQFSSRAVSLCYIMVLFCLKFYEYLPSTEMG